MLGQKKLDLGNWKIDLQSCIDHERMSPAASVCSVTWSWDVLSGRVILYHVIRVPRKVTCVMSVGSYYAQLVISNQKLSPLAQIQYS